MKIPKKLKPKNPFLTLQPLYTNPTTGLGFKAASMELGLEGNYGKKKEWTLKPHIGYSYNAPQGTSPLSGGLDASYKGMANPSHTGNAVVNMGLGYNNAGGWKGFTGGFDAGYQFNFGAKNRRKGEIKPGAFAGSVMPYAGANATDGLIYGGRGNFEWRPKFGNKAPFTVFGGANLNFAPATGKAKEVEDTATVYQEGDTSEWGSTITPGAFKENSSENVKFKPTAGGYLGLRWSLAGKKFPSIKNKTLPYPEDPLPLQGDTTYAQRLPELTPGGKSLLGTYDETVEEFKARRDAWGKPILKVDPRFINQDIRADELQEFPWQNKSYIPTEDSYDGFALGGTIRTMAEGGSGCPPDHYWNGKKCVPVLYVDPNDPAGRARYKAYQDSLSAYNDMHKYFDMSRGYPRFKNEDERDNTPVFHTISDEIKYYKKNPKHGWAYFDPKSYLKKHVSLSENILPEKIVNWVPRKEAELDRKDLNMYNQLGLGIPVYKKPVQPLVYKLNPEIVAKQQQLIDAGYKIGTADGIWGDKSKTAWEEFQKTKNTPEELPNKQDNTIPEKLPLLPPQLIDTTKAELQGEYQEEPEIVPPSWSQHKPSTYRLPTKLKYRGKLQNPSRYNPIAAMTQDFSGYEPLDEEEYVDVEGRIVPKGFTSLQDIGVQRRYNKAYDEYEAKQQENEAKQQFANAITKLYGLKKYGGKLNYIETELDDEKINEYRKGGYIVEDISVPKLQDGGEEPKLNLDLPEQAVYGNEEKRKLQGSLIDKYTQAKKAYQDYRENAGLSKQRLKSEGASSINVLKGQIKEYKSQLEEEKKSFDRAQKALNVLKKKDSENWKDAKVKDVMSAQGVDALRDLYSQGKISDASFKDFYDNYGKFYDREATKTTAEDQQNLTKSWYGDGRWMDNPLNVAKVAQGVAMTAPLAPFAPAVLANPVVQAGLTGYGIYDAATNTLPAAYRNYQQGEYAEMAGNLGMAALDLAPIPLVGTNVLDDVVDAGKYLQKGYNQVATGNSALPIAWKVEKSLPYAEAVKNSRALTDKEAEVLRMYLDSPYSVNSNQEYRKILDNITQTSSADLSQANQPLTRINNYYVSPGANPKLPTRYGQKITYPSQRSWSLGESDVKIGFENRGKQRVIIPSKYVKEAEGFHAIDYTDPRLVTDNINRRVEREIFGNVPEGYKVIGRSNEGGFENIIIKPIGKKSKKLTSQVDNINSADNVLPPPPNQNFRLTRNYANGGSLAPNIPTYYQSQGTPIYRDTTALPFATGGDLDGASDPMPVKPRLPKLSTNDMTAYIYDTVVKLIEEAKASGKIKEGEDLNAMGVTAQILLESGNGKSGLTQKYNNFGGLKANDSYIKQGGKYVGMNAAGETVKSKWRVYDTPEEGLRDQINFYLDNPRYRKAGVLNAKSAQEHAQLVQNAGYAGNEKKYARQVMQMANSIPNRLKKADPAKLETFVSSYAPVQPPVVAQAPMQPAMPVQPVNVPPIVQQPIVPAVPLIQDTPGKLLTNEQLNQKIAINNSVLANTINNTANIENNSNVASQENSSYPITIENNRMESQGVQYPSYSPEYPQWPGIDVDFDIARSKSFNLPKMNKPSRWGYQPMFKKGKSTQLAFPVISDIEATQYPSPIAKIVQGVTGYNPNYYENTFDEEGNLVQGELERAREEGRPVEFQKGYSSIQDIFNRRAYNKQLEQMQPAPIVPATIEKAGGGFLASGYGSSLDEYYANGGHIDYSMYDVFENGTYYGKGGQMIKRADGSYSQRGLWDNIRANKGSGKAPTKEMLAQERKIKKMKYGGPLTRFYPSNIQEY